MPFQDFKLHFLGTLYSWSHVLNDRSNLTFLDFVDNIMHGPRGHDVFVMAAFVHGQRPLVLVYINVLMKLLITL